MRQPRRTLAERDILQWLRNSTDSAKVQRGKYAQIRIMAFQNHFRIQRPIHRGTTTGQLTWIINDYPIHQGHCIALHSHYHRTTWHVAILCHWIFVCSIPPSHYSMSRKIIPTIRMERETSSIHCEKDSSGYRTVHWPMRVVSFPHETLCEPRDPATIHRLYNTFWASSLITLCDNPPY